jgi:putative peptidoglycan lipid II flippase
MPAQQVFRQTFKLMSKLAILTFPAAGGLALLARPIVTLVYARGAFDTQAVLLTTGPFAMYALGLGFHTLSAVLVRTFQSRRLLRYPIAAAMIDILLTGALNAWVISRGWGATGIAGVNTAVAVIRVGLLLACAQLLAQRNR